MLIKCLHETHGATIKTPLNFVICILPVLPQPRRSVYCAVRTGYFNSGQFSCLKGPTSSEVVAGLLLRRPGFNPTSLHVRFVVEKVALGQVFLPVLRFRPATVILPVVVYGCETWSLTLREERKLRVFENRVLRRIFGA